MNRKGTALLGIALLAALLSPLTGTIAEETDSAVQVCEVVPAVEPVVTKAPEDTPAPAATAAPTAVPVEKTVQVAQESETEPEEPRSVPEPESEEVSVVEITVEPTAEPTVEPTAEPTVEVTVEPAVEPTAEITAEPTIEITVEPTTEITAEPTIETTAEPTAEITAEPTIETTAEPTAEITAEPTVEITVEPTAEITAESAIVPTAETDTLMLELYADQRSAFAGDRISANGNIAGGTAPYIVNMSAACEDIVIREESITLDTAGAFAFTVQAMQFGDILLTAAVTDAAGFTASAYVVIPVAVKETESRSQWEEAFEDFQPSGIWAEDLLAIARSQLGYGESTRNFIVLSHSQRKGYTRYGDWCGMPYEDWSAMFVSFCLHYAGISAEDYPADASCQDWKEKLIRRDAYAVSQNYVPRCGDLIFFNQDASGDVDHMGIVEQLDGSSILVIEGNSASQVKRNEYRLDDSAIDGYANTALLMQAAVQMEPAEEPAVEPEIAPVPEEKICLCIDEAGLRVCSEDCICTCHTSDAAPVEELPALLYTQWQPGLSEIGLCYTVDGAMDYLWQRGIRDENGEMVWEDLLDSNAADLMLPIAGLQALKYVYRCAAVMNSGEVVMSEEAMLVRADLAEWIAAGDVTEEMLARAVNARSLDSLVVVDDILVHVRTGKAYAKIDAETGHMIDIETGLVVAVIDFETGMVYSVSAEAVLR